ncbi:gamma-glutamylcyclotransferase [Nanchangia anserum]|uniref:Gamma-glutamylcyclotransferase n=1 Tax=Nanchangia anserum TaxID=2692125 RepID=A0A8I0GBI7_9ACTO|nr:gamma-glutamylcyclotransferase family protein [Nanchangia anserum]MBD3689251.1 gamma-glutamylcyclotransferase [Nanchangia anserum]QOX81473.1 gamma-glutamylcyclotransferase [Nanchangia anserum]
MDTTYRPFFFYGTSQPDSRGFGSTLASAVSEHAPATLPDATLYIGSSYPLCVRDHAGTGVAGTICLLDERQFDRLVREIDEQEGYIGEGRSDNLYVREVAWVDVAPCETWSGQDRVRAYVYFAAEETMEDAGGDFTRSPSGNWANHAEEWEAFEDSLAVDDDVDDVVKDED